MVAIFTGAGFGFEKGSASVLGGVGLLGGASQGRGNEGVFVNAATGNLLLQKQDEFLAGLGPDASAARTYNSLTTLADDNGDRWRMASDRRVYGLAGTLNAAGSTVRRVSGDGTEIIYSWDGSRSAYLATEGAGAYDTIVKSGAEWVWTDGDSRTVEHYFDDTVGRIKRVTDNNGVVMNFTYDASNRLDKMTTSDGSWIQYQWSGASNNISQIVTGYVDLQTSVSKTRTSTRYGYDGSNRLQTVTVDLSPDDNSIADGNTYVTTYGYDGGSRVNGISQSDGSYLAIDYDAATGKATWFTQTTSAGVTRVTALVYYSGYTLVTDPAGQVTRLDYDASGNLTKITAPPAYPGGAQQVVQFGYNANFDLVSAMDAFNNVTWYSNTSANGLAQAIYDRSLNWFTRTYDASNHLLSETHNVIDATGGQVEATDRYVYDATGNLRFAISAEGRVTEYQRDAYGQLVSELVYAEAGYTTAGTPSDATMVAWRDGLTDRSWLQRTEHQYDARGNLKKTTRYGIASAGGAGLSGDGIEEVNYVHDQAGRLISTHVTGRNATTYVYDGMDRVLATTDANGGTTTFVFTDTAGSVTTVETTASGYVATRTYNKAGDLVSVTDGGANTAGGTTTYAYDQLGRVRVRMDANSVKTYTVYDSAGRHVGDVDAAGYLTEYRYDANNRLIGTIHYRQSTGAGNIAALGDPNNTLAISSLRPSAHAEDTSSWTIYDGEGRVLQTILGDGSTAVSTYDGAGRLQKTTSYFNKIASSVVAGFLTSIPTGYGVLVPVTPDAAKDAVARNFYDKDGLLIGMLDGEGYLVRNTYDSSGQLVATTAYANATNPANRASGNFNTLLADAGSSARDRTTRYVYDGRGLLRFTVDALNQLTKYDYDTAGLQTVRTAYATAMAATADYTCDNVKSLAAALESNGANRRSFSVYDAAGRVVYAIDAGGLVTGYLYDNRGQVTRKVEYATTYVTSGLPSQATMDVWQGSAVGNAATRITRTWYTERGEAAYTVDAQGYISRNAYDAEGRLASSVTWPNTFAAGDGTTFAQVAAAAASAGTPQGRSWLYDSLGRVTAEFDGKGIYAAYYYHGATSLVRLVERAANGNSQEHAVDHTVYDGAGRAISVIIAEGTSEQAITSKSYDGKGNLAVLTDPRVRTTQYSYDLTGRLKVMTDAAGGTTSYEYNPFGEAWKVTDPRGNATYSWYDNLGRVTSQRDSENYLTTTSYTALGDIQSVRRWSGQVGGAAVMTAEPSGPGAASVTSFTYDQMGRVLSSTDALGQTESYAYNAFGDRTQLTNRLLGVTEYGYDRLGRLVREQVAASTANWPTTGNYSGGNLVPGGTATGNYNVKTYAYDAFGNRKQTVEGYSTSAGGAVTALRMTNYLFDANGQTTTVTHDQVTTVADDMVTIQTAVPTETYDYDARGNVIRAVDAGGAATHAYYDRLDRKIAEIRQLEASKWTYSAFSYDANGNLTSTRTYDGNLTSAPPLGGLPPSAPSGTYRQTDFAYDNLNRLTTTTVVSTPANAITSGRWSGESYVRQNVMATGSGQTVSLSTDGVRWVDVVAGTRLSIETGVEVIGSLGTAQLVVHFVDGSGNYVSGTTINTLYGNQAFNTRLGGFVTVPAGATRMRFEIYSHTTGAGVGSISLVDPMVALATASQTELPAYVPASPPNMLYNASFAGTDGWILAYNPNGIADGGIFTGSGKPFIKLTVNSTSAGLLASLGTDSSRFVSVSGGTRLSIETGVEITGSLVTAQLALHFTDDSGNYISGTTVSTLYGNQPFNTRQGGFVTVPYGATRMRFEVYSHTTAAGVGTISLIEPMVSVATPSQTQLPAYSADPSKNLLYNSSFHGGDGWVIAYDPYGIVAGAPVASVNHWTSSIGNLVATNQYDADGNVVKSIDANGNATWNWYDKLGRKIGQLDAEAYLTAWSYDAEGNVLSETRYATSFTGTPSLATMPSISASASDRTTLYTYDLNGNRRTETRTGVAAWDVDASSGALSQAGTNATVEYTYNALGQVVTKTVAGVQVAGYSYDNAGRLASEHRASFIDANGAWVTPTTFYQYDALGDLVVSTQAGAGSTYYAAARTTTYRYGEGGRLLSTTDAENNQQFHYYDQMGRLKKTAYNRIINSDTYFASGAITTVLEAQTKTYDLAGRVLTQSIYSALGGSFQRVALASYQYNNFDQVVAEGQGTDSAYGMTAGNARYQTTNQYDAAGRLIASNGGDGVWKYYGYDANGNQTALVTSAGYGGFGSTTMLATALGLAGLAGVNATYTAYDGRNMALRVVEEGRDVSTTVTNQNLGTYRSYNPFGEVASETNAAGATVTYTYNTMGRKIRSESAAVLMTAENGATYWIRPAEDFHYDLGGRLVASRDANGAYAGSGANAGLAMTKAANDGNLTRYALLAGTGYDGSQALITSEFHADGGRKQMLYDVMGDARVIRSELWSAGAPNLYVTEQTFDRLGRAYQVAHDRATNVSDNSTRLIDNYAHDQFGQRIQHVNNQYGGYFEKTAYDALGRVISQTDMENHITTTAYAWDGTLGTSGLGTFGGWSETTSFNNPSLQSTSKTDIYGREVWKSDLGGHAFATSFDAAGRAASRTSSGTSQTWQWYNTGMVRQSVGPAGTDDYGYDKAGNRTSERTINGLGQIVKDIAASYDLLGRLTNWNQATLYQTVSYPSAGETRVTPAVSTSYAYDAVGNIRRVQTTNGAINGNGDVFSTSPEDYWFRYDAMNRLIVDRGILWGGSIIRSNGGWQGGKDILYDAAGRRVSTITTEYEYYPDAYFGMYFARREDYAWDGAGHMVAIGWAEGDAAFEWDWSPGLTLNPPGYFTGIGRSAFAYDLMGRQIAQTDVDQSGTFVYNRVATYNRIGQVTSDIVQSQRWNPAGGSTEHHRTDSTYDYTSGGHYLLGAIGSVVAQTYKNGAWQSQSATTNAYGWWDGSVQTWTSTTVSGLNAGTNTTYFTTNGLGQLTGTWETAGRQRNIAFTLDGSGQVIRRDEYDNNWGAGDPHEAWYRLAGREIGYTGNNGSDNQRADYAITERQAAPYGGAFRQGQTAGALHRDFVGSYEALNSYQQGSSAGNYTVSQSGETLRSVALALWGDASLWYKLAEANGLQADAALVEGQRLALPAGVARNHYNAQTLKPYDAEKTLGDVSPTPVTPKPAKKNKCGVFGQILLAVVAIAVTAIAPFGSASIGAVMGNAAAGSVASQSLGVVTGIQDKFSFGAVALSAVGGGLGAGLSGSFGSIAGSPFLGDVARGALGSAVTQGIGVATGLQDKFSWAGVAAAGVGNGIGLGLGRELASSKGFLGVKAEANSFANDFISTAASTLANAATRSAIEGSSFGDNIVAALPDAIGGVLGRTLGGAANKAIAEARERASEARARPADQPTVTTGETYQAAIVAERTGIVDRMREGDFFPEVTAALGGAGAGAARTRESMSALVLPSFGAISPSPQIAGLRAEKISVPVPSEMQTALATFLKANPNATGGDLAVLEAGLIRDYLPGKTGSSAEAWEPFAKGYRETGMIPTWTMEEIPSVRQRVTGALLDTDFGAGLLTYSNEMSFGVVGLLDSKGVVADVSARHTDAAAAGQILGIVAGIGGAGKTLLSRGAAANGIARSVRLGREGEAAAGIVGSKVGVQINGRMRFPDEITPTTIREVKNVSRQGWTRQLRDYADLAKSEGKTFELWVRSSTQLTRNLRAARDQGLVIIRKELPGR